jgi:hypothetical protein
MAAIRQNNEAFVSTFEPDPLPTDLAPADSGPLLAFLLRQMSQPENSQKLIQPQLLPSRLDKLPLIGTLWNNLRRQLHGLSVFYAQKTAAQQRDDNQRLLAILNLIAQEYQQQRHEIVELRQRLVGLETGLSNQERPR